MTFSTLVRVGSMKPGPVPRIRYECRTFSTLVRVGLNEAAPPVELFSNDPVFQYPRSGRFNEAWMKLCAPDA